MDVSSWLGERLEWAGSGSVPGDGQGLRWGAEVRQRARALRRRLWRALPRAPEPPKRLRERDWETRVGTIELAVPKRRAGSYFPDWLLCPRRAGSRRSCRWSQTPTWPAFRRAAWRSSSSSWASSGCRRARSRGSSDELEEEFRTRQLEAGPYTYLVLDALEVKYREGGRTVNACVVRSPSTVTDKASRSGPIPVMLASPTPSSSHPSAWPASGLLRRLREEAIAT
jgi:hypothetical protein